MHATAVVVSDQSRRGLYHAGSSCFGENTLYSFRQLYIRICSHVEGDIAFILSLLSAARKAAVRRAPFGHGRVRRIRMLLPLQKN